MWNGGTWNKESGDPFVGSDIPETEKRIQNQGK